MHGTSSQKSQNLVFPKAFLSLLSSLLWGRGEVHFGSWHQILLMMQLDITSGSSKALGQSMLLVQCFTFFSYSTLSIKDKTGNVFGGLVVDKDVTSPNKSDFYLQSHPGLKGSECSQKSLQYNCLLADFIVQQQAGQATTSCCVIKSDSA